MQTNSDQTGDRQMIPVLIIVILILVGLLFISASILLEPNGKYHFFEDLFRELGIVILAVFSVSLIYELVIAKKYFSNFLNLLRKQIEQGESNGAVCEYIGIKQIFKTRDIFETTYSLERTLAYIKTGSKIRFVAVSLLYIMTKSELIKEAISKGGEFELDIYNPDTSNKAYEEIQNLQISDIISTINIFKTDFIEWIKKDKPTGKIELRYHEFTLFDSYSSFDLNSNRFGVWDSSFGRSSTRKRTFIIDLDKPLGKDLHQRYDRIWNRSISMFHYNGKDIVTNRL